MHVSSFTYLAISVGDADDFDDDDEDHDYCHSLKPIFLGIKALTCIMT